jgi:hypothetical protein
VYGTHSRGKSGERERDRLMFDQRSAELPAVPYASRGLAQRPGGEADKPRRTTDIGAFDNAGGVDV